MRTAVYRFFDVDDDLLYVGMTNNPERRFLEHVESKVWWYEVDHFEVEWFDNRFLAEDAEVVAIWQEQPRYNIDRRLPRPADPRGRAGETALRDSLVGYIEFVDRVWA